MKRYMTVYVLSVLFFLMMFSPILSAQENDRDQGTRTDKNAGNLSRDLAGRLKLSDAQESQLKGIMAHFQDALAAGKIRNETDPAGRAAEDNTVKARRDHTKVENETSDEEGTNTGNARTKNQSQAEMGGMSRSASVIFERARTEADSQIEEMLSPDQALQYGKIKSDWWDKVRETVKPSFEKPDAGSNRMEGINQLDSTKK
ncbi:MAG: hypothetical protein ACM3Q2_10095 [Syntrophothermus sp.]